MNYLKNIGSSLALAFLLSLAPSAQGQDALIARYHQVMSDFLSHDCMSFEMTTAQYGDLDGQRVLEKIDFEVIKSGDIWYLTSDAYEVLFSVDYLVSIDNNAQIIHVEKKHDMTPAQLFSNASGMEKVFEYLDLEGAEKKAGQGRRLIEFDAPSGNQTAIALTFREEGPIVEKITAKIDMSSYEELDHALDGMKIESTYSNVQIGNCEFDAKVKAIIDSEFGVLLNKKSFQGYLIN